MSAKIETYGCGLKFKVNHYFGITDITSKELIIVEKIVNDVFGQAEVEVERQLYKYGLMTCNGILCNIVEMKEYGSDLIQAYIKELDEKYKEEQ